MNQRMHSLDSLRGIASGLILTHHIWIIYPFLPFLFHYSPLRIFNSGRPPVILFFVLSGFVLSFPLLNSNKILNLKEYGAFLVRRIFRIYVPYIVAIILSLFVAISSDVTGIGKLSVWFNMFWHNSYFNTRYIMEHILLIVNVHSQTFNSVIWTLVHEMRIALIFPILVYFVNKNKILTNLFICLCLSSVNLVNIIFHLENDNGYHVTYFETFHYASMFIIGILIAKHLETLHSFYNKLGNTVKFLTFGFGMFLFTYSGIRENIITEYMMVVSAFILIVYAINSSLLKKLIVNNWFLFLGKISYSLYLFHIPVLIGTIYALYNKIPYWAVILVAVPTTIVVATLAHKYIEIPSHKLARVLGKKLSTTNVKSYHKAS